MSDASRIVIAGVLAPWAPAVLFAPFDLGAAFIAGIYSCIVFFLLGLPAIAALRHFRLLNVLSLMLSGAVIGAISFFIFGIGFGKMLGSPASSALENLNGLAFGAGLGTLVAVSYGAIAGLRNLRANRASQDA